MIITDDKYSFGSSEKALKFDGLYYIQKDYCEKGILNAIEAVMKLIRTDCIFKDLVVSLIVDGLSFDAAEGTFDGWIQTKTSGKTKKEMKTFIQNIKCIYRKLNNMDKNNTDPKLKVLDKFRGTLFEKIVGESIENVYGKNIQGVAIPKATVLYKNDKNIKYYKLKCNFENKPRSTIDYIYKDDESLVLAELKVNPKSFNCHTLKTMLVLKQKTLERQINDTNIDLICISTGSKMLVRRQMNKASKICPSDTCISGNFSNDFIIKKWDEYEINEIDFNFA